MCAPGEDTSDQFSPHTPQLHTFPPSQLSPLSCLQVSVRHLPRLKHAPHQLLPVDHQHADLISKFRDLSLSKSAERLRDLTVVGRSGHWQDPANISKSAESIKDLIPAAVEQPRHYVLSKSAERFREFATGCGSRVVTPPHLTRKPASPCTPSPHSSHTPSPHHSSHLHKSPQDTFPFSPPKPSPMSPKLLAGLGEPLNYHSLLERNTLDGDTGNGRVGLDSSGCSSDCSCLSVERGICRDRDHACDGSFCFSSVCVRVGGCEGGRWEGERKKGKEGRKVEQAVKCGAVRSPAASSPVCYTLCIVSFSKRGITIDCTYTLVCVYA